MSLYWKLLSPAKPGQERELETVQRRLDHLWNELEEAAESDEPQLLQAIEIQKMRRAALSVDDLQMFEVARAPIRGGMYVIGESNRAAYPVIEAPIEVAGPYSLDVSYLEHVEGFDDAVLDAAYRRHNAASMLEYKIELLVQIAEISEAENIDADAKMLIGLVVTTAHWLTFWGEAGYGFEPIYGDD